MFNWIIFLLYFSDAFYIYAVIALVSVFLYAQIAQNQITASQETENVNIRLNVI